MKVTSLESHMDARVNEAVQLALSQQRGIARSHPDVVISPTSQQCSSCASTTAPDVQAEHPQIEAPAVEHQRYLVDDITMPTACKLDVRTKNISVHVAYGSALPLDPSTTIHGRPIPPGYASVIVEQIVGNNEDLELDFVGGDGEKTLGDTLHGIVLWCKADIKLNANTMAPVDPDDRPSPRPPSPPSLPGQRATSTPNPQAPEKGKKKTSSLPAAGPTKKKQKTVERKLTYEKTA